MMMNERLIGMVLESLRGLGEILQFGAGQNRLAEMNCRTDELAQTEEKMKRTAGTSSAVTNAVVLLFDFAMLLAAGLPLILPQMNARSLYLAGMLAFAAANNPRRMAAALALELVSLCSYMEAIFSFTVLPMQALSLIAIAAAVVIAMELLRKLKSGAKEAVCHEGGA